MNRFINNSTLEKVAKGMKNDGWKVIDLCKGYWIKMQRGKARKSIQMFGKYIAIFDVVGI